MVEGQIHRLKLIKRQMYGRAASIYLSCASSTRPSSNPCIRAHEFTYLLHQKRARAHLM